MTQIQTIFKRHPSFDSQLQWLCSPFLPNPVVVSELEATFFSFYSSASSTVCINEVDIIFGTTSIYVHVSIVEVDGVQDLPGKHVYHSLIIGEPGPYVRYPSHSFLPRLGPQVYMLLLDCRCVFKFISLPNLLPSLCLVLNGKRIKSAAQADIGACLSVCIVFHQL